MQNRRIILFALFLSLPLGLGIILPTRAQLLRRSTMSSLRILDRDGVLLREFLSCEEATSQYRTLDQISPWLAKATLVSEDKRFFLHCGVDPIALIRSLVQNAAHGEVISGGSTITQQLARNLLHSPSRTLWHKLSESLFALNLELKLSKEEILELYLNCAPYGNQTYGAEAASHLYFRKPSRDLSIAEAAFLAGIPKAPSAHNPYRYHERVIQEQLKILSALRDRGLITHAIYSDAMMQPLQLVPREMNFSAPHFCQYVLDLTGQGKSNDIGILHTTLSLHLQREIEHILRNNIARLEEANVTNAAAIVVDIKTMECLVYAGSVDFFDPDISGEVDGVQALRQPGSALKPFTYALALENGATASTLIPDLPIHAYTQSGDYTPRNYDEKYHGMVRLRTALACSYNIPAVRVCEDLGPDLLLAKLQQLGLNSLDKSPAHYGLGLTLGNGEVTLLELTRAYAAFARKGTFLEIRTFIANEPLRKRPVSAFTPQVAYIITDILSDNSARSPAFGEYSPLNLPFSCAAKTGTSKDFRDNWCVGFTDRYLVGVWVGNFDGSPMHQVSGITGAGPIFRDIILLLHHEQPASEPAEPRGLVSCRICTATGKFASADCENTMRELFIFGTEPHTPCTEQDHALCLREETCGFEEQPRTEFSISFPDNGDIFKIDPVLRQEYQVLNLKIHSGYTIQKVTWFVDDKLIASVDYPFTTCWRLSPGPHRIKATGITDHDIHVESSPVTILVLK